MTGGKMIVIAFHTVLLVGGLCGTILPSLFGMNFGLVMTIGWFSVGAICASLQSLQHARCRLLKTTVRDYIDPIWWTLLVFWPAWLIAVGDLVVKTIGKAIDVAILSRKV